MQGSREFRVSRRRSRGSLTQEDDIEELSRVQNSCWACRKSKVRCDRQYPCGRCIRLQKSCVMQTRGRGRPTNRGEGGEGLNGEDDGCHGSDSEDDLHSAGSNERHEEHVLLQQQQVERLRLLGGKGRGQGGEGEERPEEEGQESLPLQHPAVETTNMMNVCEVAEKPTFCHHHHHHHHLDNQQQPALGSSGCCGFPLKVVEKGPGTDGENGDDSSDDEPAGPPIIFDKNGSLSGHWADVELSGVVEGEDSFTGGYANKDGGPAPWQMTGGLRPPIGIRHHDHCRAAAAIFGEAAHRVSQQGMLQHRKALAVIRTWDVYSYRHGVDIACGASDVLLRVLTMTIPEDSIVAPQEEVPSDPSLTTRPTEELLNPACMPPYVAQMKIDQSDAACGYVYANGHYRLWVNDEFSIRFFTADEANARFTQMSILPCYIYGNMMNPKDRPLFYSRFIEYLLTRTDETKEMSMAVEMVERNRRICPSLVRVRYMVMNDGQYACLAFSIKRLHNEVEEIVRDGEEETIGSLLQQRPVMKHHDTSSLSSLSYISSQAPTLSYSSSSFSSYSSSSYSSSLTSSLTAVPSYRSEPSSAAVRVINPQVPISFPPSLCIYLPQIDPSNLVASKKTPSLPPFTHTRIKSSTTSSSLLPNHHHQQQHLKYAISHHHVAAVPHSYCPPPPPLPSSITSAPPTPLPLPYHHQHPHHLASRPLEPLPLPTLYRQHHPHQQPQQQQQKPPQQQDISQHQHWIQPRQYLVPSSATYPPAGSQPPNPPPYHHHHRHYL